jgi:hypothetical protein
MIQEVDEESHFSFYRSRLSFAVDGRVMNTEKPLVNGEIG